MKEFTVVVDVLEAAVNLLRSPPPTPLVITPAVEWALLTLFETEAAAARDHEDWERELGTPGAATYCQSELCAAVIARALLAQVTEVST